MASGPIIFPGFMPCEDANGDRVAGAKAYFYLDGASTLTSIYADADLTTELPNPVEADAVGTWPAMWADQAVYFNVALTDADGVPLPDATWSHLGPAIDATTASVALSLAAKLAAEDAELGAEAALAQAQALLSDVTGEPLTATSITPLTIGGGPMTLTTVERGKLFSGGQTVVIAYPPNTANQMVARVDDYDPDTGVMHFTSITPGGAGEFASWEISLGAVGGAVSSVAGLTGAILADPLKAALALDEVENLAVTGRHGLWIPASAMTARTTNGAAVGLTELGVNKVMLRTLDFDASTLEYAQFNVRMPKAWDEGAVTAVFAWCHGATAANFKVSWGLQGVAISDDDALDAAFGAAQYANDVGGTTSDSYASPETAAIAIAGAAAAEDLVVFQVLRKADDAVNDTLAVDARLIGVTLYLNTEAGNDA